MKRTKTMTCRTSSEAPAREIAERDVERYLQKQVRQFFGTQAIFRKVTWQGRRSAPDRVILVPPSDNSPPAVVWVELKRPGKKPTKAQAAEHARMRAAGANVKTVCSFSDADNLIRAFL